MSRNGRWFGRRLGPRMRLPRLDPRSLLGRFERLVAVLIHGYVGRVQESSAPHPSPYLLPNDRDPVLIHEGALELRHNEGAIHGEGRLELVSVPALRFT